MIRLSGSVKLRCAFASGAACFGSGTRGWPPPVFFPVRSSCFRRWAIRASASAFACAAFCRASASIPPGPVESSSTAFPAAPIPSATGRSVLAVASHPRPRRPPRPASATPHFRLQRLFGPPHPPITHRLVLAGVRLEFRPVDRHMPQFHQPRLPAQSQRLQKQSRQRLQMPFPKLVERAVIRCVSALKYRNATSSCVRFSICRELTTPVQYPYTNNRTISTGSRPPDLVHPSPHRNGKTPTDPASPPGRPQIAPNDFSGSQSCNDGGINKL